MKKLLAILLALAMVLSLAACGADSDDDDDKKDKKNKNEAVEDVESDEDIEDDEDDKPAKGDKEDKDDKDDKPAKGDKDDKNDKPAKGDKDDKPAKDDKDDKPAKGDKDDKNEQATDLIPGTSSDAYYQNKSLGLEFSCPSSSWTLMSTDELLSMIGASGGSADDMAELLDNYGMYYDMCAVNESTGDSVQIIVQDLSSFGVSTDDVDLTEDELMDILVESIGATIPFSDVADYEDVVLGTNVYTKALCEFSMSGVSGEMACYLRMGGDYVVYIAITSIGGNSDTIEACFG